MPELPEVETVRRGLEQRFVGRRITQVEVGRERSVRRTSREEVIARLTGVQALQAQRRGKYLLCPLSSGDSVMIHLRMSGQVLIDAVDSAQHVSESVLSVKRERRRFMHPGKEIRNKRFRRIGITGI